MSSPKGAPFHAGTLPPFGAEKDAGWLVPQTCVRCGEQTLHDNRVCGRCCVTSPGVGA